MSLPNCCNFWDPNPSSSANVSDLLSLSYCGSYKLQAEKGKWKLIVRTMRFLQNVNNYECPELERGTT
jgi:hypothetical protein